MQAQAAPHKFTGFYPNKIEIPDQYLPYELKQGIMYMNSQYDEDHYIKTGIIRYPMLMLQIKDKELWELATSKGYKQYLMENKMLAVDFEKFNDIDCEQVSCTCKYLNGNDYEQIFGKHENYENQTVILYRTCKRTIFAAAKRQIKSAPTPDQKVCDDFLSWAKAKIDECLGQYLDDFGYSYNQWFNHLNASKQKNMIKLIEKLKEYPDFNTIMKNPSQYPDYWKMFHYEGICKKELQGPDGKPRMVCSIPDIVKYVMGPICWKLEEIFTDHLPCYCGGMNLTEMQNKINKYIDEGFTLVAEGDGSAFDNTQDVMLKELDRYVYNRIADTVYHVDKELFLYCANAYYKIMDIVNVDPIEKKRKTLMTYAILGTVFSGDCDTTLMNTMRMGLYNWYTNEKAELKFGRDFICFSKGDDFTVMYSYRYDTELGRYFIHKAYKKYWLAKNKPKDPTGPEYDNRCYGLGQILKFIEFGEPNSIKFCSLRAWYYEENSQHIYLTRNPEKFYNLGMYSRKLRQKTNREAVEFIIQQAVALYVSYPKIKFFNNIIKKYLEAAAGYSQTEETVKKAAEKIRDRRVTLSLEIDAFDDVLSYYNLTPRKEYYQLKNGMNFWESMQDKYKAQEFELSDEQASYVNRQIEEEFDSVQYQCEF